MNNNRYSHMISRRTFLKVSGLGALALAGSRIIPALARQNDPQPLAVAKPAPVEAPLALESPVFMRLAATDGHFSLPGRAEPLYGFGFIQVPTTATVAELDPYKGNVQWPAPIIGVDQGAELYLTLTNIGLQVRPDLDDAHTVHWHGFRNPIALFDGVPEVSISVPPGRDFPYFYHPDDPGTYMYHCHFEDVEHVQMGMTGIVFVRPAQNYTGAGGGPIARLGGNPTSSVLGYAYNDGVAPAAPTSTAYDREFTLLLNEVDTRPHDNLEAVQEFLWTDYKANFWLINGRSYPHTTELNDTSSQPISSLIQVNPNDRVLLRLANLGYDQHSMQLPGIPMRVVGEDATFLQGPTGADLSYFTNTIYIGPGEARDVLFTAPAFNASKPTDTDAWGTYNRYYFKNRNFHQLNNNGQPGLGGMVTEVRVYDGSPAVPAQTEPNQTYP